MGKESVLELSHADSSVSIFVVSSDEELYILSGWEHVDGVESGSKLVGIDLSISGDIKDLESISEVEIVLLSKHDLSVLEFLLLVT